MDAKVALFENQRIRRVWHNNEWWLSVVDVCKALTGSPDSGSYWRKLKQRLKEEGSEVVTFCHGLKLEAPDGKLRETDCANIGSFDLKVDEYKDLKGLDKENLRDHMNDIELILTMLAEATTTKIHKGRDSQGFPKLKKDAKDGGGVAGRTRKDIEQVSGKKVISTKNYLLK